MLRAIEEVYTKSLDWKDLTEDWVDEKSSYYEVLHIRCKRAGTHQRSQLNNIWWTTYRKIWLDFTAVRSKLLWRLSEVSHMKAQDFPHILMAPELRCMGGSPAKHRELHVPSSHTHPCMWSLGGPRPMHSFSEWDKLLQARYTLQATRKAD